MSLFTNCGEYLPGQEPPTNTPIPPGPPNVIVPRPRPLPIPPFKPTGGRRPWQLKYKCVDWFTEVCPPETCGRDTIRRRCLPCDGNGSNPNTNEVGCDYLSLADCNNNCEDTINPCNPQPERYRCFTDLERPCPPPETGTIINRECVKCDPTGVDVFGCYTFPNDCNYVSLNQCNQNCVDEDTCVDPGGSGGGGGGGGGPATGGLYTCVVKERRPCPPITPYVTQGDIVIRRCVPCVGDRLPILTDSELALQDGPLAPCQPLSSCQILCTSSYNCTYTSGGQPVDPQIAPRYICAPISVQPCPPITISNDPPVTLEPIRGSIVDKECIPCIWSASIGRYVAPSSYKGVPLPTNGGSIPNFCEPLSACVNHCSDFRSCVYEEPTVEPRERRWQCGIVEKEPCPKIPGQPIVWRYIDRECQECLPTGMTQEQQNGIQPILNCNDPAYVPGTGACWPPQCSFTSEQNCLENCGDITNQCPSSTVIITQYPGGSTEERYKCVRENLPCTNGQVGVQTYIAEPVLCQPDGYNNGNPYWNDPQCIYSSRQQAIDDGCVTQPGNCIDPNGSIVIEYQEANVEPGEPQISTGVIGIEDSPTGQNPNPSLTQTLVTNAKSLLEKALAGLGIAKNQKVVDPLTISNKSKQEGKVSVEKSAANESGFHATYNFFNIKGEDNEDFIMVDNDLYNDIFSNKVTREVRYVLKRNFEGGAWDERPLQKLSDEKIALSLNPILLKSLNNIHYSDGEKIPLAEMLNVIRSHMLTGSLNLFDQKYFIELAQKQSDDEFKTYVRSADKTLLEAAALAVLKDNEVTITKNDKSPYDSRRLIRGKKLNVDVGAKTCIIKDDGTSYDIKIGNSGLSIGKLTNVITEELEEKPVTNGPGDGYYLYLNVDGECLPYNYTTKEEVARYIPQYARVEALKILGENPDITISCESLSGSHEFTSGLDLTIDYSPIFLKLDIGSISSTAGNNYLIDSVSATYNIVVDQSQINEHLDTYGFGTTRVNIDYRDPLFKYIYDTSTLKYSQRDITFNQLKSGKFLGDAEATDDPIISRDLPFSLVITPVAGSRMNPFNVLSNIDSIGDKVKRSISLTPTINYNDEEYIESPLEEKFLYLETGNYKVGLKEKNDPNALTYRFNPSASYLRNTYYNKEAESYGPISPEVSSVPSYGLSFMVKDVIDYIYDNYGVSTDCALSSFTWFDIYRRLPMTRVGQVFYDSNESLLNQIASGLRENVYINDVYTREVGDDLKTITYGGSKFIANENYNILDEDEKVVITVDERISILNSPPPTE